MNIYAFIKSGWVYKTVEKLTLKVSDNLKLHELHR